MKNLHTISIILKPGIDVRIIKKFTLGDENGNFRPDENLTRAQFTAFMYRALGL
ncbi:S-layer homology domain-containing protein [Lysinibacillus sp. CTST325]